MSTQHEARRLVMWPGHDTDALRPFVQPFYGGEMPSRVKRFIAHPDGQVFVEGTDGGRWFHQGRGRLQLWPYLMTA